MIGSALVEAGIAHGRDLIKEEFKDFFQFLEKNSTINLSKNTSLNDEEIQNAIKSFSFKTAKVNINEDLFNKSLKEYLHSKDKDQIVHDKISGFRQKILRFFCSK